MLSRLWNFLLKYDPTCERLEHSLKVTLVFSIAAAIAMLMRKPLLLWLPLMAIFLPDVGSGFPKSQRPLITILFGASISIGFIFLTEYSQFKLLSLVLVFTLIFLSLSLAIFGNAYNIVGLYLSIFTIFPLILTIPPTEASHIGIQICCNILAATAVVYLCYFHLLGRLNLQLFTVRSNVRKSFRDLAALSQCCAGTDYDKFMQTRMNTWNNFVTISRLLDSLKISKARSELSHHYVAQIWRTRRLFTLLFELKVKQPQTEAVVNPYCLSLAKQFRLLKIPYQTIDLSTLKKPTALPDLVQRTIDELDTCYRDIHATLIAANTLREQERKLKWQPSQP